MTRFLIGFRMLLFLLIFSVIICCLTTTVASANNPPIAPESGSGSIGLQGTISEPAPTQAATIVTPATNTTVNSLPVTVSGLCPKGLLVKVFSNDVFVGSTECTSGSYSLPVDLFGGSNQIVARVYDSLDQAGPDSNIASVMYNSVQLLQFDSQVFLTSSYAKRGANPDTTLTWPIILSGGTGPYAISVDWGDGSSATLLSSQFAGTITLTHVYNDSGVYTITVKATDSRGTDAFLQLVGVANGATQSNSTTQANTGVVTTQTKVLWWPAVAMVPLIPATFWVGRRHELFSLRRRLEKTRQS